MSQNPPNNSIFQFINLIILNSPRIFPLINLIVLKSPHICSCPTSLLGVDRLSIFQSPHAVPNRSISHSPHSSQPSPNLPLASFPIHWRWSCHLAFGRSVGRRDRIDRRRIGRGHNHSKKFPSL